MSKPKNPPTPFEDAAILWECEFPSKPDQFQQLIRERVHNKLSMDVMEGRIKEINGSILPFFKRNAIKKVEYDGSIISLRKGTHASISREKLLQAGVSAETIEACMYRAPWETIEVRSPGFPGVANLSEEPTEEPTEE